MLRQRLWVCPYEHAKWPSLLQRISLCFCLTLGRHSASIAHLPIPTEAWAAAARDQVELASRRRSPGVQVQGRPRH